MFGYGDKLNRKDVQTAFETSLAAGLNLFDTAEIYGWGHSERVLGELVRDQTTPVLTATKYAPFPWRFGPGALPRALDRSLQRLGLDRVDLYQIHFPGGFVSIEKLMHALADALDAGKVRAVGVSNYGADQMRKADAVLKQRGHSLASNQVEYSLVRRSPEVNGVLDACRDLDVTLIAYSPLGRGVLTGKYRPGASPSDASRRLYSQFKDKTLETMRPLLEALREIGEAHDRKPSQVALNWLARQSHVLPIPGAKNERQARENAETIGWELSEPEAERLDHLSRSSRVSGRHWYAR
jgi:aryl-alcohol dehydrogenase-like predicted oxidoreductase